MDLIMAVKAVYEVAGQDISDLAIQAIVKELSTYQEAHVQVALTRCMKELRRVTLADILDRLPNGHPGPEEAWAVVAPTLNNEAVSIVWTDQMAEAAGTARSLSHDPVAARLAFKESYTALVQQARLRQEPPKWQASLGYDQHGREQALQEAVEKGRIAVEYARKLLPDLSIESSQAVAQYVGAIGKRMAV